MNSKFISKKVLRCLSRFNARKVSTYATIRVNDPSIIVFDSCSFFSSRIHGLISETPNCERPFWSASRNFHSALDAAQGDSMEDAEMTEFLSRFVWIMRGKLKQVYPDCDKKTIDGMLLVVVQKVVLEVEKGGMEQTLGAEAATSSGDFSDDLWKTVWEVSNMVLDEMRIAKRKERTKKFLHCEEVKRMYSFAVELGIRGDFLRELWFKWAREQMQMHDDDQDIERRRAEYFAKKEAQKAKEASANRLELLDNSGFDEATEKPRIDSLPERHGKIKYRIYGLDLSGQQWSEVADKIHEAEGVIWPQEPKPISGKCKVVTDKILSLEDENGLSPLLAEWVELLQPSRVDWMALLDRLKENNSPLYFKVAEHVLGQDSFQPSIEDYSKLIDLYAKGSKVEDVERILNKMSENGIFPDVVTYNILVHMYGKLGDHDRAKEAFENLRRQGFQPDIKVYTSMIMAYVTSNQPSLGESLVKEMEFGGIRPTREIYMALLKSFSKLGDARRAHGISTLMQFAGFPPSIETCSLLIEAYGRAGEPEQARSNFDYIRSIGHRPDDTCVANMVSAYEKGNSLDKALGLLMELEKDGIEPGVATYSVLVDWFGRLLLVDEVEQILGKIGQMGESPPFRVHVSLCEMYSMAGLVEKARRALGVVEAKMESLDLEQFERIVIGLTSGGFVEDAKRIHEAMKARGFRASEKLEITLMTRQAFGRHRPVKR